jgi:hypothetical protein
MVLAFSFETKDKMIWITEWINEAKREIENDKTGEKKYLHICEETGVIPASHFLSHIQEKEFCMKYHGLGPNGAKAIAWPLKVNSHTSTGPIKISDLVPYHDLQG